MDLSITSLLKILFESLFIGLAILIPVAVLIRTSNLKFLQAKDLFILQGVQTLRIAGIFYAMLSLQDVYSVYFKAAQVGDGIGITFPVSYQLFLFYPPAMYLIFTQLLWIKTLYMKKAALIGLCIILLIFPTKNFIAIVTALVGDNPAAALSIYKANFFARVGLSLVISFFTAFALMVLSGKMKKVVE